MKTIFPLSISLSILISSPALYAQSNDTPDNAVVSPKRLDSEDLRGQKKLSIGAELGFFVFPFTGFGVRLGYALNPNFVVGFSHASGSMDATSLFSITEFGSTYVKSFEVTTSVTELEAKYFVGNSFYLGFGVGQRTISYDLLIASFENNSELASTLDSTSTTVNLSLGNIWTLDNGLYIGGEWIAANIPISSSFEQTASSNALSDNELQETLESSADAAEELGNITSYGLAQFVIGYQF